MPEKSFASPRASSQQNAVHATDPRQQPPGAINCRPFATPRHGDPYAARQPARCAAQRGQCRENPSPPRATGTLMQQGGPPATVDAGKHSPARAHLRNRTLFMRQARRSPPGTINCRPFATPRHRGPHAARRPPAMVDAENPSPARVHPRDRAPFMRQTRGDRRPARSIVAPFATPRHGDPYAARRPARCAAQPPGAAVLGNLTGPLSAANRTGPSPGFSQKNRAVAFRLRSCLFSYTAPTYSSSVMS